MSRKPGIALCGLLLVTSVATRALADPNTEQARVYFDAGAQAYSAGRYPVAIEAFSDAYKLAPRPAILFSLAQAERKQFWIDKKGDGITRAIRHYREYLAAVPEGGRRDDAATALAELEPAAARLDLQSTETGSALGHTTTRLLVSSRAVNARASIDGAPPAPVPRLVELPAGPHHVVVSADGFFQDARDVVTLAGVTTPVELNLREEPALLTVEAESGSTAVIDGRAVGTLPSPRPFDVANGHHELTVTRNGRQIFREEINVERGRSKTVIAPLIISRQRRISEVVLTVGGAAVVSGGVFLGVALGEQGVASNLGAQRQAGNISPSQLSRYNDAISLRDTWRSASIATFGGGVAVLAAGAGLFFFDHPTRGATGTEHPGAEPTESPTLVGPAGCGCSVEVSAIPLLGPGLGGAGVVGRF